MVILIALIYFSGIIPAYISDRKRIRDHFGQFLMSDRITIMIASILFSWIAFLLSKFAYFVEDIKNDKPVKW